VAVPGPVIEGIDSFNAKLRSLIKSFPRKLAASAKAEMEIEKKESMRKTPWATGKLRDSHVVLEPEIDANGVFVQIQVGGPGIDYAIPVHEDLFAFHPHGEAKFLESTINESKKSMGKRIALRCDIATEHF
jgi:hypothetical protein